MIRTIKAQTWSFDLIIAVVLFVVVVGLFYSFLSADTFTDSTSQLEAGANNIINALNCDLASTDVCVLEKGQIQETKLDDLTAKDYADIKKELGVTGEFCIYLRDPDGSLVEMPNSKSSIGKNTTALFSNSGVTIYCGEDMP